MPVPSGPRARPVAIGSRYVRPGDDYPPHRPCGSAPGDRAGKSRTGARRGGSAPNLDRTVASGIIGHAGRQPPSAVSELCAKRPFLS